MRLVACRRSRYGKVQAAGGVLRFIVHALIVVRRVIRQCRAVLACLSGSSEAHLSALNVQSAPAFTELQHR
jgi:hypothetical protein